MKQLGLIMMLVAGATLAQAQKKLYAMVSLDSSFQRVEVKKNTAFGVLVQVEARTGLNWDLAMPPAKCRFTESKTTEAATLPGVKETRLMIFKATEPGIDSIRFFYRKAGDATSTPKLERVLEVTVQ